MTNKNETLSMYSWSLLIQIGRGKDQKLTYHDQPAMPEYGELHNLKLITVDELHGNYYINLSMKGKILLHYICKITVPVEVQAYEFNDGKIYTVDDMDGITSPT